MIVFPKVVEAKVITDGVFEAEAITDGTFLAEMLSNNVVLDIEASTKIIVAGDTPTYKGAYEFTPSENEQVINIEEKKATADIVINPIPEGWGKITWDGRILTVS